VKLLPYRNTLRSYH